MLMSSAAKLRSSLRKPLANKQDNASQVLNINPFAPELDYIDASKPGSAVSTVNGRQQYVELHKHYTNIKVSFITVIILDNQTTYIKTVKTRVNGQLSWTRSRGMTPVDRHKYRKHLRNYYV
jgi:hypothetical protein